MRARNIKPGFFDNEEIGAISMSGRILFIGLWCLADKHGILEYRPQRIKIKIFPYDSLNAIKFLEELSEANLIDIWCDPAGERLFIEIPTFLKHQKPHPKEKGSDLREILDSTDGLIKLHENKCNSRLMLGKRNVECGSDQVASFDDFYSAYPKKAGKAKAASAWKSIKPSPELLAKMLTALSQQKETADWKKENGQFIPHPTTWLNQKRWEDEITVPAGGGDEWR